MRIERRLLHFDRDGGCRVVDRDRLESNVDPVVILGDPGMGKTTLLRGLCERTDMTYVHAAALVRADDPEALIPEDALPVVDGLDEIASPGTGSAVGAVLGRLRETESLPPVLACRAAEWRGGGGRAQGEGTEWREAADLARIEDAYGGEPTVLYLPPFDEDEARAFLAGEYPGVQVHALLQHLRNRELAHVCGNPLVLRMFAEAARGGGGLPGTRAELLERASRAMAGQDRRSRVVRLVRRDEEDLLLASGAICATMLLCDLAGVHDCVPEETPAGFLNVADIAGFPFGGAASEALATRLFRADGEGRFSYFHRVLAEYLGAGWLARCVDEGVVDERVHTLFGRGVPTALRGMHAWMARLSPSFAERCIAADPWAVLRDGEIGTLDLDRARALLAALKERSGEDPCFNTEDRGPHPAAGLMRSELKDEIVGILASPGPHAHLSACLAEALSGTELSVEAGWTLEGILFDPARAYGERAMAFRSLWLAGVRDGETAARRLLDMEDAVSARLACEAVVAACGEQAPARPASRAGPAKPRLVEDGATAPRERPAGVPGGGLFGSLDGAGLATALDGLATGAPAAMGEAGAWERSAFSDVMRRLVVRVLEDGATVAPERVWSWIGWTRETDGGSEDARERLAAVFGEERALRAGLVAHVLLMPRVGGARMGCRELEATGLELDPDEEDFSGVLAALGARSAVGAVDPDLHEELLALRRSARAAADPVHELGPPMEMPGWTADGGSREAAARAARLPDRRSLRRSLSGKADLIAAGDVEVLAAPAAVWLGRFGALDPPGPRDSPVAPEARLREVLGGELSEQVLDGFVAVLGRDDLPSAREIAEIHCTGGEHEAEAPLICGIAVALGRGPVFDTVRRDTLEAAYMAWLRAPGSASDRRLDNIGSTLDAMVFTGIEAIERHFRASIEPQLAHDVDFVHDLDRMAEYYRFAGLAGRLSVEWSRENSGLNGDTQAELLTCAIESAPREALRDLIVDCRGRMPRDGRARLLWLAAACLVDPDGSRGELLAAADDPNFLGHVREAIAHLNRFADAPLESLVFVVQAFGARWPRVADRPGDDGKGRGWTNPREASAFIERTIHAISNRPQAEATDALRNLIANHAPSYADTARQALAFQGKARRDCEQVIPTVAGLRRLMVGDPGGAVEHEGV